MKKNKKKLKCIAISEDNYQKLKERCIFHMSFNDVITSILNGEIV
jgi:hypothetical protein